MSRLISATVGGMGADEFGYSVSIGGNTALIGAYSHDALFKGDDMGSAYVFLKPSPICSLILPLLLAH